MKHSLLLKGVANNIDRKKVLKVTTKNSICNLFSEDKIFVSINGKRSFFSKYFLTDERYKGHRVCVSELPTNKLEKLTDGDIVSVSNDGVVSLLWDSVSSSNVLYTTDFCNSDCIMCPQYIRDKGVYYVDACDVVKLLPKTCAEICVTGGEPTFFKEQYLNLMNTCKKELSESDYLVLTNGKNFEDFNFVKEAILNSPLKITYAIPIYSSDNKVHDYVVNAQRSLEKTIKGIYNLYKFKQDIEIRIVIIKQNYKSLVHLAHFIYWNFPFVKHIALMGMEVHGNAESNLEEVWIEPTEYMEFLSEAVYYFSDRGMNVSIYNLPLCLLPKGLWRFSRQSISDWKNSYLHVCEKCSCKNKCAGFFETSSVLPKGVHSI